ncbi:MAG: GlsB/YeaQ/YmgE family stress response membrane protein [Sandaracinaceae bacterium]
MLWMILTWIVFGLIVGALARLLVPGRQSMGLLATMALGVGGSFIGGFLANLFTGYPLFHVHPAGFIGSVLGAILILLLAGLAHRRALVS